MSIAKQEYEKAKQEYEELKERCSFRDVLDKNGKPTDFAWGYYPDTDFEILIHKPSGRVHGDKMCQKAGDLGIKTKKGGVPQFCNWKNTDSTRNLIEYMKTYEGVQEPIKNIKGSIDIRGDYIDRQLVPHLAIYLSPAFAFRVSKILNEYLSNSSKTKLEDSLENMNKKLARAREIIHGKNRTIKQKDSRIETLEDIIRDVRSKLDRSDEIQLRIMKELGEAKDEIVSKTVQHHQEMKEMTAQHQHRLETTMNQHHQEMRELTTSFREETKETLDELSEKVNDVQDSIDATITQIVPSSENKGNGDAFAVVVVPGKRLPYHTIRCQQGTVDKRILAYKRRYPHLVDDYGESKTLLKLENPNSVNLFHRIKEQLGRHLSCKGNDFDIIDGAPFSERELKRIIKRIDREKEKVKINLTLALREVKRELRAKKVRNQGRVHT